MARKLIVEVLGDTSGLDRGMRRAKTSVEGMTGAVGRLRVGFGTLAKSFIFIEVLDRTLRGLHETIHAGAEEVSERAKVQAQLNAALASTGNVAHVSKQGIDDLALSLSNLSGIDDEIIKGGEAVLLQFTNIRNFAGKNNDIFDRATKVAVDFSVKSGKSVQQASLAIGRALQDPAKASTALRRAQVVLTASEKQAIAIAVRHGDTLKAQKLLIDDLLKRYGGQAKALGQTLPGMIQILRQRLRDLAGDLGGKLEPNLKSAARSAVSFVKELSEAGGARAKLRVVFEGLENLGEKLVRAVRAGVQKGIDAVERIDWGEVKLNLRAGLERAEEIGRNLYESAHEAILDGIERLKRVDWNAAIDSAARNVGDALVVALEGLTRLLERVNWANVGRAILLGIEAALYAVVRFLVQLPWGSIVEQIGRLLLAALRAATAIFRGIADELARQLGVAIRAALADLGLGFEQSGLKIALKIIEPFSHLPRLLGGGWARDLKEKLKAQLDALAPDAQKSGKSTGRAYARGVSDAISSFAPPPLKQPKKSQRETRDDAETTRERAPAPPAATGISSADRQRMSALRNQWFDSRVTRELDKLSDLPIRRQTSALQKIAGSIEQRIAATKDITRKLDLEDRLRGVLRQIKTTKQQLAADLLDALSFSVDRAAATATLRDDLAALRRLEAGIKQQIATSGRTLELARQLFETQQRITEVRKQTREARQYRALGFGPTGEDLVPGVKTLKKQLDAAREAIRGTFLDTRKERGLLGSIADVLSGQLGKVSQQVRQKIAEILANIRGQLKQNKVDVTKYQIDAKQFLAERAGIDPIRRISLARRLASSSGGGGAALTAGAGVVITGPVHVYGVTNVKQLEQQLLKRSKQRQHRRRGAQ